MSDSSERLSYKFQRLREVIRQAIERGELKDKLPGERTLARRFGANAKTVGKALTDLTLEGVLVRRVGRGTYVVGQQNPDRQIGSSRRYLWLASTRLHRAYVDAMYDLAEARLLAQGHRSSLEIVEPDARGELPARSIEFGRLRQLAGLIVLSSTPSRAFLADLARRRLPVVFCNARSLSLKTDGVVADYALGTFELAEHLLQLGHRRIRLVVDRRMPWVSPSAQRGYHTAMARYGIETSSVLTCDVEDASSVAKVLTEVSAVICGGGRLAAAVRAVSSERGMTVPNDLSLTTILEPGELDARQLALTSYDVEPDRILDWVLELLFAQEVGQEPREAIVPGVFRDRGSTRSISTHHAQPEDQHLIL